MISVVVPVYKVENYLHACIQSVLRQTYSNYELILVDDGSPDDCPAICDKYASMYSNVRVLHKKNGGPSEARNLGTNIARGEYVTYVDGDDYVSEKYLETLIDLIENYHADIAVVGMKKWYENDKVVVSSFKEKAIKYSGVDALELMLYQKLFDTSPCRMLIPIEIAKSNPFPYQKLHEDDYTTYKYCLAASSVVVTNAVHYFYLQRKDSIMHTFGQANLDELDAADNLYDECTKISKALGKAAKAKQFSNYCQVLIAGKGQKFLEKETYWRIVDVLEKSRREIICNPKVRLKNKFAAIILRAGPNGLLIVSEVLRAALK